MARTVLDRERCGASASTTELVGTIGATVALNLGGSIGATPLGATDAPAVDHLLELLARPPWQRDALCREHPDVSFFPARGESSAPAKAVCTACLVRPECLVYAVEHDEPHGVWGGLSARERREVLRVERAS